METVYKLSHLQVILKLQSASPANIARTSAVTHAPHFCICCGELIATPDKNQHGLYAILNARVDNATCPELQRLRAECLYTCALVNWIKITTEFNINKPLNALLMAAVWMSSFHATPSIYLTLYDGHSSCTHFIKYKYLPRMCYVPCYADITSISLNYSII